MTRFVLFAVAVLVAAPASASEPAEALEQTALAPDLFRGPKALEWTATVLGGGYRGPLPENGAGALEVGLGIGWPSFTMGLRLSLDSMSKSLGLGVGGQVGPRFRLSDRARVELLAPDLHQAPPAGYLRLTSRGPWNPLQERARAGQLAGQQDPEGA
jgi:hypothetical protein